MISITSLNKHYNKKEFYDAMSGGIMAMILIAGAAAVGGAVVLGATDLVETGLTQASVQIPTANLYKVGSDVHMTLNIKNAGNELLAPDNFVLTVAGDNSISYTAHSGARGANDAGCAFELTPATAPAIGFTATTDKCREADATGQKDADLQIPSTMHTGLAPGDTWAFTGKVQDGGVTGGTGGTLAPLNLAKGSEVLITVSFGDISQSVTTRVR